MARALVFADIPGMCSRSSVTFAASMSQGSCVLAPLDIASARCSQNLQSTPLLHHVGDSTILICFPLNQYTNGAMRHRLDPADSQVRDLVVVIVNSGMLQHVE